MKREGKRHVEDNAYNNVFPPKIQKQGISSSQVPKDDQMSIPKEGKAGGGPLTIK